MTDASSQTLPPWCINDILRSIYGISTPPVEMELWNPIARDFNTCDCLQQDEFDAISPVNILSLTTEYVCGTFLAGML